MLESRSHKFKKVIEDPTVEKHEREARQLNIISSGDGAVWLGVY